MACLQCNCFPILEYFSCRFRSMVYTVVKQGLFASRCSQTFTVGVSLTSGHFPPLLNTSSFFFSFFSFFLFSPVSCLRRLPPSVSPVPRVVAVSPQMRLVEDNPSSLSLVEIYKQRCAKKGIEHDNPISRYYDRLATVQARGTQASHQV